MKGLFEIPYLKNLLNNSRQFINFPNLGSRFQKQIF